jgi:hypothetical protein
MRFLFVALLLAGITTGAYAQNGIGIEANFVAGKIFKHTDKFNGPIPDLSTAFDLAVLKQTTGTLDWEQRRHYPIWGVGATYTNYGVDSIYGGVYGIYPLLQTYLIRGKRLQWTLRGGMGLAYVTKHYERAPNWDTLNNAIGSAINNFTTFSTDVRYRLNDNWSIQAGLNFSHCSNGDMKQPNLGINMWGGHVGLRFWPAGDKPMLIDRERPKLSNRILAQARIGIAFNELEGPVYQTYLASVWASKRYKSRNKVFIGLDYSYHTRIYAFQRNNEINIGQERANSWKSAVFVGHEWMFGRFAIVLQMGVYVKEAMLRLDKYYQKIGYNYYLLRTEHGPLKELCLSVMLKTHKTDAELVEYGIGLGF